VNVGKKEIAMNRPAQLKTLALPVSHSDHLLGPQTARVTLLEYGDFECPSCGHAYHAVKILLKHFGERVRFAFRHYPLREAHPHAELAAEAAEAAGAQDKFWPMHDLLFENQLHLKANNLRQHAEKAELELARYDFEMSDHVHLQRVQEHIESGTRSRVRSTPAFFVNGIVCDVSFGLENLQRAIETGLRA
jgi:protein-disulfide isomerase